MNSKSDYFIELIFKKLKQYKRKDINLEKENFKEFILLLIKEN